MHIIFSFIPADTSVRRWSERGRVRVEFQSCFSRPSSCFNETWEKEHFSLQILAFCLINERRQLVLLSSWVNSNVKTIKLTFKNYSQKAPQNKVKPSPERKTFKKIRLTMEIGIKIHALCFFLAAVIGPRWILMTFLWN